MTRNYIASGSTQGRPYRLFWTDGDWQGPPIDLSGKFVKIFGPASLITPEYGDRVATSGGMLTTQNNVVVYGVFLDRSGSSITLYAYSGGRTSLSGQFILAYYDSGAFDELKHIQVIEVGQPDIVDMTGFIGEAIQPHGSGHTTEGLRPQPVANVSPRSRRTNTAPTTTNTGAPTPTVPRTTTCSRCATRRTPPGGSTCTGWRTTRTA